MPNPPSNSPPENPPKTPTPTLHVGDCLQFAKTLPTASIDMIYIDPPYFTKRDFATPDRTPSPDSLPSLTFSDRWPSTPETQDRDLYLAWLADRIREFHRLLTPTGTFLLHLDWHIVHYAKVLCDQIFSPQNFRNEIIWHYQTGGASKGHFSRKHDTILFYSKSPNYYFDGKSIAIPRTQKSLKRAACPTGARIKLTDTHKNPEDVLTIPALNPMSLERTGYPTQKPLALLTRLITALCPPTGTVADFFCGSGTTLLAAQNLHRQYIGSDLSPAAITLTTRRLQSPTHKPKV